MEESEENEQIKNDTEEESDEDGEENIKDASEHMLDEDDIEEAEKKEQIYKMHGDVSDALVRSLSIIKNTEIALGLTSKKRKIIDR